ncbi:MAG TPA: hypothetical protein VGQ41_09080 [Pyrinomonadaceae bacterium]|jgi:hypothetical protein|nr:hypothetical protein [Pyrinomonadaceae bacterium]
MRNKIYTVIAIFGMFLGLAVANAQGQAASKVTVEIPFEFSAGKTTLHAGVYSIKRMSGDVLSLRSEDGKSAVILNAPVTHNSNDPNAVERLVFSKQGNQYFLSQIWLTADTGRQVWKDRGDEKAERIEIALRVR